MGIKETYAKIGFDDEDSGRTIIASLIGENENGIYGAIGSDYSNQIGYALADDIAEDIASTADLLKWGMDDVRLAFGRVLCRKLNIPT